MAVCGNVIGLELGANRLPDGALTAGLEIGVGNTAALAVRRGGEVGAPIARHASKRAAPAGDLA